MLNIRDMRIAPACPGQKKLLVDIVPVQDGRTTMEIIEETPGFGQIKVWNVKLSDARRFYIELPDRGIKRNTITGCHSI